MDIGFTLPSTSVSTNIDPSGSDIIILNLYSSTFCFLYSISMCLFPCWCCQLTEVRRKHKEQNQKSSKEQQGTNWKIVDHGNNNNCIWILCTHCPLHCMDSPPGKYNRKRPSSMAPPTLPLLVCNFCEHLWTHFHASVAAECLQPSLEIVYVHQWLC